MRRGVLLGTIFHTVRRPLLRGVVIPAFLISTGIGILPIGVNAVRDLGLVVAVGSVALFAWAAREMMLAEGTAAPGQPTSRLVTTGPFRFVRNPLYDAVILGQVAAFLLSGAAVLLPWIALTTWLFVRGVPRGEEPFLRYSFGEEYERYLAEVPRWLPRLGRRPAY